MQTGTVSVYRDRARRNSTLAAPRETGEDSMSSWLDRPVFACRAWAVIACAALAVGLVGSRLSADTGAVGNGDWSSAATWTNGLPSSTNNAYIGSPTPTGTAATATVTLSQNTSAGDVYLGNGAGTAGTLDLSGLSLTASTLYLGQNGGSGSILRTGGGTVNAAGLFQGGGTLTFAPGDVAGNLTMSNGAFAATTSVGNLPRSTIVGPGCTLSLGADLMFPIPPVTSDLHLGGTLNMNGHAVNQVSIFLGANGPFTIMNRGPLGAANLNVSSAAYSPGPISFSLTPADSTGIFNLLGVSTSFPVGAGVDQLYLSSNGAVPPSYATATTSAVGNVRKDAYIAAGCTLTLGADLALTYGSGGVGNLTLDGTLITNGHSLSARAATIRGSLATFQADGPVSIAGSWTEQNGAQVRLRQAGDALGSLLLQGNSSLTFADAQGQVTGLTITGQPITSISIDAGSDLVLEVNGLASGWVFRWANPAGGDHLADLQNLINAGEVVITPINGGSYSLSADAAYTYVNVVPVPEPSAFVLSLAAVGFVARRRFKN